MAKKKTNSISEAIKDISKVETKKYLPVDIKIAMVDEIAEGCGTIDNGVFLVDGFVKEILLKLKFIANYTNISMEDIDVFKTYDTICESNFLEHLFSQDNEISKEYIFIKKMLDEKLEQECIRNNSVAAILTKGLDLLSSKIPSGEELEKTLETLKTSMNELDPNKLEFVKKAIDNFAH